MRIVFLGTPDFSVPTLQALVKSKHEVIAVVTQPDKKRDRNVVSYSPVKTEATNDNIPVLQYEKIRVEGILDLKKMNPDMMVTCAYGQIISQEILDIPKYGVINVHASLLPKYRGSSPIQWAIINGEKETGITIMKTALGVDSGDIILQEEIQIKEKETAGELFDRLSLLGPNLLLKAIDLIESGNVEYKKQEEQKATHFPMLKKEDGKIDWTKSAKAIVNQIYGMNPWPSAYTMLNGKVLKIWQAEQVELNSTEYAPGEILKIEDNTIVVCGENAIKLEEIQLEGKKRMPIKTFLLGNKLNGEKLY